MPDMKIELVTDVVCPWCYLGWHRLKAALALRPGVKSEVIWRPFQLNPSMPAEGVDYKEYMAKKFAPDRLRDTQAHITEMGKKIGLDFRFDAIPRAVNTSAAHRLILWAQDEGKLDVVADAVMRAYFSEGKNIGDTALLADIGAAAGMDRAALIQKFADGTDIDRVTQSNDAAHAQGIDGVPFYVMGDTVTVEGSRLPENLALAIDQAQAA